MPDENWDIYINSAYPNIRAKYLKRELDIKEINGWKDRKAVTLYFTVRLLETDEKIEKFKKLYYQSMAKEERLRFPQLEVKENSNNNEPVLTQVSLNNSIDYLAFTKIIYHIDAIFNIREIRAQLLTALELPPLCHDINSIKEMANLGRDDDAQAAAIEANEYLGHENTLYELGQHYESLDNLVLALKVYQIIPKANCDFEMANSRINSIVANQRTAIKRKLIAEPITSEAENLTLLEIDSLLNSPESEQEKIDRRIHELSGGKGFNPVITNVRYDAHTILAFCRRIQDLTTELNQLKSQVQKGTFFFNPEVKPLIFEESKDPLNHSKPASAPSKLPPG